MFGLWLGLGLGFGLGLELWLGFVMFSACECVCRPGTCNLFHVTGQIATLQWSPGPDNVEHVNEG